MAFLRKSFTWHIAVHAILLHNIRGWDDVNLKLWDSKVANKNSIDLFRTDMSSFTPTHSLNDDTKPSYIINNNYYYYYLLSWKSKDYK